MKKALLNRLLNRTYGKPISKILMLYAKKFTIAVLVLLFPIVQGCVTSPESPKVQQLTRFPTSICRLAVLPFINESSYVQGDTILYRIFVATLNRRSDFSIVQEGDVRKILRQLRISPKQLPDSEQLVIIADRLGVDAIITGKIILMKQKQTAILAEPEISVDLKMINAANGKMMLTAYHSRTGEDYRKVMHFGLVNTITELSSLLFSEILDDWQKKGLRKCEK